LKDVLKSNYWSSNWPTSTSVIGPSHASGTRIDCEMDVLYVDIDGYEVDMTNDCE